MKYSILNLILFVLLFASCEDELSNDLTSDCGLQPTYLEEDGAIISDPFQITSATMSGNCLEIEVMSGGCDGQSWEGQLFVFPEVAESYPPQVGVQFSLKDEELCEAAIRKTFTFDLSGLYEISDRVIIHLDAWEESILFPEINADFIMAKWDLININGGLSGVDQRFDRGEVTWEFDTEKVDIQNNSDVEPMIGFETGTYDYSILESEIYMAQYELEINGNTLGPITYLSQDSLIVDQQPVDGFQYVLIR